MSLATPVAAAAKHKVARMVAATVVVKGVGNMARVPAVPVAIEEVDSKAGREVGIRREISTTVETMWTRM